MRRCAVVSFLLSSAALAEDPCVTVSQRLLDRGLELWAELGSCSDVSITVTAGEATNVVNALPGTVRSRGKSRFLVAKWRQADADAAWRVKDWKYRWKVGTKLAVVPAKTGPWRKPFSGDFKLLQGPHGTFSHGPGSQDEEAWDWAMPEGTPVLAARDGVVVAFRADREAGGVDEALRFESNYVMLRHEDGTYSEYNHLQRDGVRVSLGQRVKRGQVLGVSGNTGFTSEPHLHFSVFHTLDGTLRESLPFEFEGSPAP